MLEGVDGTAMAVPPPSAELHREGAVHCRLEVESLLPVLTSPVVVEGEVEASLGARLLSLLDCFPARRAGGR